MRRVLLRLLGLGLAVLLAGLVSLRCGECSERVAVLEFRDPAGALATGEQDYLVDAVVRGAVRKGLPADKYLVMTKETMIELLQEQKIDFEKVCEGSCELDVGRKIGAHYIVTGSCWRIGESYQVAIKLYDTRNGNLLSQETASGSDIAGLGASLAAATREILKSLPSQQGSAVSGPVFVRPPAGGEGGGPAEAGVAEVAPTERPQAGASGAAGLYITTEPAGAEVYLGTVRAGTTDPAFQKMDLKPGSRVRVTLRKADYRDKVFEVELAPGVTKYEGVKLDPAFGTLVIESEPSGAKVVIGGKEAGLTPYRNERMPSGEHLVSLSLDMHRPVENEVVEVRDGEVTKKLYPLEAEYGVLGVDSEPPGARVLVGGKEMGQTPAELKLSPGRYEVGVELDGYRGRRFEVTVARGRRVAIGASQARLERKEFRLTVAADPPVPGARIWLDGRDTGKSAPDTLEGLSEGEHTVEVRAGGRVGKAEVAGQDGEHKTVTIPLEEAPASAVAGSGAIAGRVAIPGGDGVVQVTNGLVGHWPLDGNAEDVSGNGNHGTVEGATFTHDRFGVPSGACHFDGGSARVRVPHSPSLDVAGQNLTMACWVRADPDQYFRAGIVNKTPGSMPDCGYRIWLYENKVMVAVMHAQEGVSVLSPSPVNDNQWHHVVGVFENGSLRLFVDGDLVSEDYSSHGFCSNEADLLIGSYWYPYDDGHEGRTWCSLKGEIDDVRIYNRALRAEEVRSLYHLQ